MVEVLLQLLVGKVDAELLKAVLRKVLEPKDIQNSLRKIKMYMYTNYYSFVCISKVVICISLRQLELARSYWRVPLAGLVDI